MKRYCYRLLASMFTLWIRMILRRHEPKIVAVTGSVGKTGTTQAILHVLRKRFRVRGPLGNYNTELGVPLAMIGMESPGRNVFGWARVFGRILRYAFSGSDFPEVLVLELGADHPGEIRRLTRLLEPHVGVVTAIGEYVPVHREFFKTTDQLIEEKQELVRGVREGGLVVLNADDPRVLAMRNARRVRCVTAGVVNKESDLHAVDVRLNTFVDQEEQGEDRGVNGIRSDATTCVRPKAVMTFRVAVPDGGGVGAKNGAKEVVVELPQALSEVRVLAALQAMAVGLELGMDARLIVEALKDFSGPPGRLRLLGGIKRTVLIDDSYNASPASTHVALSVLENVDFGMPARTDSGIVPEKDSKGNPRARAGRKIACLGNMGELGGQSRKEHRNVGERAATVCDVLMTVGSDARAIAESAVKAGMSRDCVFSFALSSECGRFLQERMQEGDVVLIKGSQSVRMERVTKEVMAEPEKAASLLVRQTEWWFRH